MKNHESAAPEAWTSRATGPTTSRSTASAVDLSPSEILADPDRFDGRSVTVRGTVTELRELGNAYFSFDLTDGERAIRVLSSGTPACGSGAAAAGQGVFQKVKREGYKIYREVEAGRVTCEAR